MANVNENRVNTTINAVDLAALDTATAGIKTLLEPYFASLTDDERTSLFSLAEENLVFAHDALERAKLLGNLFPPALSSLVTNLENDFKLYEQMDGFEKDFIAQISQSAADTKRLAAHETYVGSLAIYKIIEALATMGVAGAKPAYDILKERFANQGGRPAGPPTP